MSSPSGSGQANRFRHSIRLKLLLVSLSLLAIPWAGYRYIQETESFLRQAQENNLLGTAQAVATVLHNRGDLFIGSQSVQAEQTTSYVYIQRLRDPIQLDGYVDDWRPYLQNRRGYPESNPEPSSGQAPTHFYNLAAENSGYLYLWFDVIDERIVYQRPGSHHTDQSDYIELLLDNPSGDPVRYRITTTSPGWVVAEQIPGHRSGERRRESRIQGEWQESTQGYSLELRIPKYLLGERIAFAVADVDNAESRSVDRYTASTATRQLRSPGVMIRPNPEIANIISGLEHKDARIWVIDHHRQVLASRGALTPIEETTRDATPGATPLVQLLFSLVLNQPSYQFEDTFRNNARLQGVEVDSALNGNAMTYRRKTPDDAAVILSAAWPINRDRQVIGAVLVEQTTNQILSLQNQALERLFGISLLIFLVVGLLLLGFATLLVGRIRRLRDRVESVVTPDGQITGRLPPTKARDEIGDLGRSFSRVMDRLAEYNRYLEAMASRLAHEMRTPLTVVQSSLEHLESLPDRESQQRYIERAREGSQRLARVLDRMREATRLEQTLQQSQIENFDLSHLLATSCDSYQAAFNNADFILRLPADPVQINGTPDLISQALDKLVANAVDFHTPGTSIEMSLELQRQEICLQVSNQGPALPEEMQPRLFDSMVSIRDKKGREPHLGLGLYLVRLIADFHGGSVEARNLDNPSGVRFSMRLPGNSRKS